jgi:hypothetical protein
VNEKQLAKLKELSDWDFSFRSKSRGDLHEMNLSVPEHMVELRYIQNPVFIVLLWLAATGLMAARQRNCCMEENEGARKLKIN